MGAAAYYQHDATTRNNIRCWFLLRKIKLLIAPSLLLVLLLVLRSMHMSMSTSSLSMFPSFLNEGHDLQQHDDTSSSSKVSNSQLRVASEDIPPSMIASSSYWNLSNPTWPLEPPTLLPDCKVVFRKNNNNNNNDYFPQRLCHIVPWGANFGDELGPPIVKRILELYFHCSAQALPTFNLASLGRNYMNRSGSIDNGTDGPCLLTVGSMWRMAQSGDHLWGTGVAFNGTVQYRCQRDTNYRLTNLTIYSSRGPNSVAQIHKYCPFAAISSNSDSNRKTIPSAGDAGFLIPYLFPEYVPRDMWPQLQAKNAVATITNSATTTNNSNSSTRLCIIPHHDERNNRQFRIVERQYGALRLTVQQSWQDMVVSLLTKCDKVLSSSLHGIIFAETLGLVSKRFRLTQQPGNFKFDDFYTSYRGGGGDDIDGTTTMDHLYARNLTSALNDWIQPLSIQQRDAYARRILETFPIHLFETVPILQERT